MFIGDSMMQKVMASVLALFLVVILVLSAFEWTISYYHTSWNQAVINPTAHKFVWQYLLKQHYLNLIDLEILSMHEKRHLLDIKRTLETLHLYWQMGMALFMTLTVVMIIKFRTMGFDVVKRSLYILTFIFLMVVWVLFDFLDFFKLFHTLLFVSSSWVFPENSYLIQWFPLVYFQQFFVIVFLKTLFMVIFFYCISSFLR